MKWPQQGEKRTACSTPVGSVDFFPTLLEMAGFGDEVEAGLEGVSIAPLVRGEAIGERPLHWHFPHYSNHGMHSPGGAIRLGKYKLLEYFENGSVQLFDLEADIGEQKDLSQTEVEKAKELQAMLHEWRKKVDAQMMKPNPDFDPGIRAEDYHKVPAK